MMDKNPTISSRLSPPGRLWLWTVRALAVSALILALYLTIVTGLEGANPVGCGPGSACDEVLSSRWSKWLRVIPVSALAVVVYAFVLASTVFLSSEASPPQRRRGWMMLMLAAVMIVGAVGWFVILQVFGIGRLCAWCLSDHAIGFVMSVMILWRAPTGWAQFVRVGDAYEKDAGISPLATGVLVMVGLFGIAAVVIGQVVAKPKSPGLLLTMAPNPGRSDAEVAPPLEVVDASPSKPVATAPSTPIPTEPRRGKRVIRLNRGTIRVDLAEVPLVGSPDAEHVMLSLFDYTCTHCRHMHGYLTTAQQHYGDQLTIAVIPVPLHPHCNPNVRRARRASEHTCDLTRLALSVWLVKPEAFGDMHSWLFQGDHAPTKDEAHAHAVQLVGAEPLRHALANPRIDKQIRSNIGVHDYTGGNNNQSNRVPKLIHRDGLITGTPKSTQEMLRKFEAALGIKPLEP